MSDLRDKVPESDPDKDALQDYALTAVDALVPIFGGVAADLSRGVLARRADERQHAFNRAVAEEVVALAQLVDGLTPESIVESDEFMAAFARGSRAAAETDSAAKRARLARVVARMGPWNDLAKERREYFFDLTGKYNDIHVFLLKYFVNPAEWLRKHDADFDPNSIMMGAVATVLERYVFPHEPNWRSVVNPALGELQRDGMADVPLSTMMSGDGTIQNRTTIEGSAFLSFLAETDD